MTTTEGLLLLIVFGIGAVYAELDRMLHYLKTIAMRLGEPD